jgi:hypothetical protein
MENSNFGEDKPQINIRQIIKVSFLFFMGVTLFGIVMMNVFTDPLSVEIEKLNEEIAAHDIVIAKENRVQKDLQNSLDASISIEEKSVQKITELNQKIDDLKNDKTTVYAENSVSAIFAHTESYQPSDLFYTFLKADNASVSQSPKEHYENNKYIATDIATNGKKLDVYAPSFVFDEDGIKKDEAREYTVHLAANYATMGETVELHWKENGVPYNWAIGHMNSVGVKEGDVVTTGDKIGVSGGCLGELKLNEVSSGCHVHIELRIDGEAVEYPLGNNTKHTDIGFQ